jgi:hypothetical protein
MQAIIYVLHNSEAYVTFPTYLLYEILSSTKGNSKHDWSKLFIPSIKEMLKTRITICWHIKFMLLLMLLAF